MKKYVYSFIYVLFLFTIFACSAYKTASKEMEEGKYAEAFKTSIKVFTKNSSTKKKAKQLILLQNSYLKANEQEEEYLKKLKLQYPANYKEIYYLVKSLYDRVNLIKPHLPLYNGGKELKFPIKDYSYELKEAKENYLKQYYAMALDLLATQNKNDARKAYEYLTEIKNIDTYYQDVNNKQKEAYYKGADIIYVSAVNQTGVSFPESFRDNFLYQLDRSINNFWTIVTTHSSDPRDYEVNVIFRQAFVGNDIVTSNTYNYEKNIVDGWEYLKDRRGNIVTDSLGNTTKIDRYIKVNARITEFVRHKEAMLSADIQIYNSYTGSLMENYPVSSQFAFNSSFATLSGDKRALDSREINLINTLPSPFPTNYEMISQCGLKLRGKLLDILNSFE